ncbi:MAG: hypothetical protein FJ267_17615, partial [Planctomycetes bacterium]|nr:hypothetical protein [Planctomycetota bacterium]
FVSLGDWRQVCPVDTDHHLTRRRFTEDRHAFATTAYHTTLLSSPLWCNFRVLHLTENVRQENDAEFHRTLLRIGNGSLGPDVPLSDLRVPMTTDFDEALKWLYEAPSLSETAHFVPYSPHTAAKRAYICPFNSDVDTVNEWCTTRICGIWKVNPIIVKAVDSEVEVRDKDQTEAVRVQPPSADDLLEAHILRGDQNMLRVELDAAEQNDVPVHNFAPDLRAAEESDTIPADFYASEFMKRQYFDGVPQAELLLAPRMVVILLRNIDASRGLMNGVRLEVVRIRRGYVIVKHIGDHKEHVIPKIKFDVTVGVDKLHFNRLQVPLRLAYSCTIHKSQAATLDRAVVDLREGVFDHGQLYVALSRVRSARDVLLLIRPDQEYVLNIV